MVDGAHYRWTLQDIHTPAIYLLCTLGVEQSKLYHQSKLCSLGDQAETTVATIVQSESPHKPLNPPRFLRPFEPLIQKDVSRHRIDNQKPHRLREHRPIRSRLRANKLLLAGSPQTIHGRRRLRGKIQSPQNPRDDEVPGFNEGRSDQRERGSRKPDDNEADAGRLDLLLLAIGDVGLDSG